MALESKDRAQASNQDDGNRLGRSHQSVKLPEALRGRLRMWAAFLNKEISEIVEEAVAARLDQLDRKRARQGEAPIPDPPLESDGERAAPGRRRAGES